MSILCHRCNIVAVVATSVETVAWFFVSTCSFPCSTLSLLEWDVIWESFYSTTSKTFTCPAFIGIMYIVSLYKYGEVQRPLSCIHSSRIRYLTSRIANLMRDRTLPRGPKWVKREVFNFWRTVARSFLGPIIQRRVTGITWDPMHNAKTRIWGCFDGNQA